MPLYKSDDQLNYIIKDCYQAIAAYPQGYKTPEYFATAKAAEIELNRREGVQTNREILKTNCIDRLTVKLHLRRHAWQHAITDHNRKVFDNACFSIGFNKLHNIGA